MRLHCNHLNKRSFLLPLQKFNTFWMGSDKCDIVELKPKKEFEMSCIYCGSKLEKVHDKDGYNILECSNPKCRHNRTSCRMDKIFLRKMKVKLEKELAVVEKDLDIIPITDANIPKEKKCEKCGRRMVRYTSNKYCEIWVCPTFFRKSQTGKWNDKETKIYYKVDKEKVNEILRKCLTDLGIGEYFTKDSRFSENIILRAIELFFKYPWANHNDVVRMLADEGVEVSTSTVYEWIIHSSILLRWGQGVENTSVLQAEVESTPCTGDK